ncbi:MAG: DUF4358 domain-containing protein [Clostridia bacterium]|nr:DUF4358 domain-containing protein [Clostridia bacterium]
MLNKKEFIFASIIIIGLTIIILYFINDTREDNTNNNNLPPATTIPSTSIPSTTEIPATDVLPATAIPSTSIMPISEINSNSDPKIENPVVKLEDEKFNKLKTTLSNLKNDADVKIFNDMISLTSDQISTYFNIDMNKVESFIVRISSSKFESSMYIIMKPIDGYKEDLISLIKKYMSSYERSWMYLDETQYDIVVNRKAIERNGYIVYVLSIDNSIVLDKIRKVI